MILRTLLVLAICVSALQVILARHDARVLFIERNIMEKKRDALIEEWRRLQLELSTWTTDPYVETEARNQLGLHYPDNKKLLLLGVE